MPAPGAILVIGPSWVGDMVMAQVLFQMLAEQHPGVRIDVTAPGWARGVLQRMPEVGQVIDLPFGHGQGRLLERWAFGRALRGQYQAAYVLPGSWKSAIVPFAAGISLRVGFLKELRWGLLNRIVPLPKDQKKKTVVTYQALADASVFADRSRLKRPSLRVDAANQTQLLIDYGLTARSYAVLMPGAEYGPAKRWPAHHFATLAQELAARGVRSVLLGSAKDSPAAQEIIALAPEALDLTGKTQIIDAVDLAAGARFAVANDSGLMHIAAAVGVPVFGMYGSTSPEHTPPLSLDAEVLELDLACRPCRKRACPLGHLDCLEKLLPERLIGRLQARGVLE